MYVAAYSGITSSLILQYSVFDLIQLFFSLFCSPTSTMIFLSGFSTCSLIILFHLALLNVFT